MKKFVYLLFAGSAAVVAWWLFGQEPASPVTLNVASAQPPRAPLPEPASGAAPPSVSTPARASLSKYAMPPDPGPAGKATLLGIDSNDNGVRDDVERWVAENFGDSEVKRESLFQYSRNIQRYFSATDRATAIVASNQGARALRCVRYAFDGDFVRHEVTRKLDVLHMNTPDRLRAMQRLDDFLAGTVTGLPPVDDLQSECTFQPEAIGR